MKLILAMLKRLVTALPTLFGVVVITFLLTRALPGDPAAFFAGPAATPEAIEEIRAKLGLDKSLWTQFGLYLANLSKGDLGQALSTGQPVMGEIGARLPASLELTLFGVVFALVFGLPMGILAATRPGSWIDQACRFIATLGVALPSFFLGIVLIYVFYFLLGWAPAPLGRIDVFATPPDEVTGFWLIDTLLAGDFAGFWAVLKQLALPGITLGLFALAPLARITRASMLEALGGEYIRAATAHGLGRWKVLFGYALRNALLPIVTTLGMVFSYLLGINVLVEKVFAWPGIGSFSFEALLASDYASVQGFILTMGVLYVLLNLAVDFTYTLIDPRIRRMA